MFRRSKRPGGDEQTALSAADTLRPLLYGNLPVDRWSTGDESGNVWERFAAARRAHEGSDIEGARRIWADIVATPDLESRQYLQAWSFLRQVGYEPLADVAKKVLAVIAEMPVGPGHDVLAAYDDGSCRYLNHSGKVAVIEDRELESVQNPARAWLETGQTLLRVAGPWE